MNCRLTQLLEHLTGTLTPQRENEIESLHQRALAWEPVPRLPLILSYPAPQGQWAPYPHAEAIVDPEKMLFNELVSAWGTSICHRAEVGDDLPCTIRANFGTVLTASLFGARIEQVDDNPPWARNFETRAEFVAALGRDPLDFSQGWCPRVIERYQFYRAALAPYPALARIIKLALPDLQGPMDTVELLRGSDLYLDLIQDPALVTDALAKAAAAQIGFARHLARYVSEVSPGWAHQHGFLIRGAILIRIDSAIMLSPRMYREQIAPYDEQVLRELGGGGLHSCGNIRLNGPEYLNVPSTQCLDLGQPDLNDLDHLYALARQRRIPLLRLMVSEEELTSGSVLRRFPTGVSLLHPAKSLANARRIMAAYLNSAAA